MIPPEEREAFGEFLAYVWKTGTPSPQVGHWQTKDGEPAPDRVVEPADGRRRRRRPSSLVTTGIDLTDRAPQREDDERALEGDPEAKLAEVGRLATEQRALRRVATLVASEVEPRAGLHGGLRGVRARAAGQRLGSSCATRATGRRRSSAATTATASTSSASASACRPRSTRRSGACCRPGAPARIDDWGGLDGRDRRGDLPHRLPLDRRRADRRRRHAVGRGRDRERGPAARRTPRTASAAFCELVSLAVASAQARADLIASRARLVKAGDEQRRRLERNLHDGAQQRLVSVALKLRLARARLALAPGGHGAACSRTRSRELDTGPARSCARSRAGCTPRSSASTGLRARAGGARRAACRSPVDIDAAAERLPEHVEATAYYIVSEALTNVAKHAEATSAAGRVRAPTAPSCAARSSDDGRGGADPASGTGILGLRDRAEAAGGTLSLVSPPGQGTVVTARFRSALPDRNALARAEDILRVVPPLDRDQAVEIRSVVRTPPFAEVGVDVVLVRVR